MRRSRDEYFLGMAEYVAGQSTCLRRAVGCVLVDARGHVLSTGYNGTATGEPHCNEPARRATIGGGYTMIHPHACPGAQAPSGTNLDGCYALHDTWNALIQCRDPFAIHTSYSGCSPCVTCTKMLMNTSCTRIVFRAPYAHDEEAKKLWTKNNTQAALGNLPRRTWEHLP